MATTLHCALAGSSRLMRALLLGSIVCTLVLTEPCAAQQNAPGASQTGGTNNGLNIGKQSGGTNWNIHGGQHFVLPPPGSPLHAIIDLEKIAQDIYPTEGDREACVHNLAYSVFEKLGGKYNVLVNNAAQHPMLQSRTVVFEATAPCGDALFYVWGFKEGVFDHEGEMGYRNWEMIGGLYHGRASFERFGPDGKPDEHGRHVVFRPIPAE